MRAQSNATFGAKEIGACDEQQTSSIPGSSPDMFVHSLDTLLLQCKAGYQQDHLRTYTLVEGGGGQCPCLELALLTMARACSGKGIFLTAGHSYCLTGSKYGITLSALLYTRAVEPLHNKQTSSLWVSLQLGLVWHI